MANDLLSGVQSNCHRDNAVAGRAANRALQVDRDQRERSIVIDRPGTFSLRNDSIALAMFHSLLFVNHSVDLVGKCAITDRRSIVEFQEKFGSGIRIAGISRGGRRGIVRIQTELSCKSLDLSLVIQCVANLTIHFVQGAQSQCHRTQDHSHCRDDRQHFD